MSPSRDQMSLALRKQMEEFHAGKRDTVHRCQNVAGDMWMTPEEAEAEAMEWSEAHSYYTRSSPALPFMLVLALGLIFVCLVTLIATAKAL